MEQYFANLPTDDLIKELSLRIDNYYSWILNSGRLGNWRRRYNTYHGQRGLHSSSQITSGGEQGELSFLMSNEYRNLCQHLLVTATQQRPSTECIAINSDFISQTQTILGDSLLENYFKEKKVEKTMKRTLEAALACFDVAYTLPMWNPNKGPIAMVDPDTGTPIQEGDIDAISKTPLEVIIDYTGTNPDTDDWIIVKDQVNKFDYAASFPEKADQIIQLQRDRKQDSLYDFANTSITVGKDKSSLIDLYIFLHEKTPSVPQGRMTVFFKDAGSLWTFDGPLPYDEIPRVRVCPSEQVLGKFGYSNTNDLLSLQDVVDALCSATVTNVTSIGGNNIWSKKGDSIDYDQLAKGLSLIQSEFKPETLILNELNPQVLPVINFFIGRMQTLSGVNEVARGNLQKEMSGTAMALVQAMSIQFNSGIQAAQTHQIEETGTCIINNLQLFAHTERLSVVAGKSRSYMAKYFTSANLSRIHRVSVRQGNSYMDTTAGRVDVANKWLESGIIKTADEYTQVMYTGRLEIPIEGDQNELMTIRAENEALAEGGLVQAVWTDNHSRHAVGHKYILANPETRKDPELVKRVTAHIQEHVILGRITDPAVLMMLGIQPIPPSPMGMPGFQVPIPDGPALNLGGAAGGPNPSSALELPDPNEVGVAKPNMPKLPENALTGEPFNLEDGGLSVNG